MGSFKEQLRREILSLPFAKQIGGVQYSIRCPICGDSYKDLSHTHFYIKLDLNNEEPILYNCFRCNESGMLTPSLLRTMDIHNLKINSSLTTYNSSIKRHQKKMGVGFNDINLKIPPSNETELTLRKKKYIEDRFGKEFTLKELEDLKIVFNLGDFLQYNDVKTITVSRNMALNLHENYVGFLSAKNEYIIFRDITGKQDKRYFKYTIFKDLLETKNFYSIPNEIDLLTQDDINIHLTEGTFDIIGVYLHVKDEELKNNIYAAVTGSAYVSTIKFILQSGVVGNNINIHIYSDRDKQPYHYKALYKEIAPWVKSITLWYNTKSKDCGVPRNQILLEKKRI